MNRRFSLVHHVPHYSALFWRALSTPILVYFVLVGNFITFSCAAIFTFLEQGRNDRVHGFGDGLWWAFATVTTVGYGDVTPETLGGRATAVVLMITGILFFVGFAAVLVNVVDSLATEDRAEQTAHAIARELRAEMQEMRSEMRSLRAALSQHPTVDGK